MSDSAPPPPPPPPPSGDPYAAGTQAGEQPGGVGARIGARFVDFIIVGIVSGIISSLLGGGSMTATDKSYGDYAISGIVTAIVYLGYFAFLESSQGQTLGKMLFKLHVEGPSGGKPTMAEAVKRNLWVATSILGLLGAIGYYIGNLIFLVIFIVLIVQVANESTGRVTFMDKFAGGTRVVKRG